MEKQPALAALGGLLDYAAATGAAVTIRCRGGLFSLDVQDTNEPD